MEGKENNMYELGFIITLTFIGSFVLILILGDR